MNMNSGKPALPSKLLREYSASKKKQKQETLEQAGYELFLQKGIRDTSIDDIVKQAGVAKGTFYLYFKDKYDLLDKLVFKLSSDIIGRILTALEQKRMDGSPTIEEEVIGFIDILLSYLLDNKELLPIIHKNLSKGLYIGEFAKGQTQEIVSRFSERFTSAGGKPQEAKRRLYLMVELSNSVLYNAIISQSPYTLEEIKPLLYSTILQLAKP